MVTKILDCSADFCLVHPAKRKKARSEGHGEATNETLARKKRKRGRESEREVEAREARRLTWILSPFPPANRPNRSVQSQRTRRSRALAGDKR